MADAPADPVEPLRAPAPPTWRDLLDRAAGGDRRRWAGLVAAALLVAGAGVAGYALVRPTPPPATELLLPRAPSATEEAASGASGAAVASTTTTTAAELVVHAAGAVAVPGVHRVAPGSRVADLLAVAGGPAGDADLDRVNLAAALVDGERVWFPRIGEVVPPAVVSSPAGGSAGPSAGGPSAGGPSAGEASPADPIDINTATAEQLDTLPGVGPATAAAIIEHRERNGAFRSVDGLLDVPGIGEAKLARLRPLVTV